MQKEALERIRAIGLPTRHSEDWNYFPISLLAQAEGLRFIADPSIPIEPKDNRNEERLSQAGISPKDFQVESETDFAALLPIALGAQTLVKNIGKGESENGILKAHDEFSHTVFRIGDGARVSLEILENKIPRNLSAERLDFFVGANAQLELFSTEESHAGELKFRSIHVFQSENSQVDILDFNRTESVRRIEVKVLLNGENARFAFRELNRLSGEASENGFVRVQHNAPQCKSHQFVRNLLSGASSMSYDGGVIASANCPGTDSSELVNTILLSDDSKVRVKPTLKIYHDDVSCSHGNTVGTLDEEAIFYLTSRGIEKEKAEALLQQAFAKDLIAEHPGKAGRERLFKLLNA